MGCVVRRCTSTRSGDSPDLRRRGAPSGTWLRWRRGALQRGCKQDVADLDDAVGRINAHVAGVACSRPVAAARSPRTRRSCWPASLRARGPISLAGDRGHLRARSRSRRGPVPPARGQQRAVPRRMAPGLRTDRRGATRAGKGTGFQSADRSCGFRVTNSAYQSSKSDPDGGARRVTSAFSTSRTISHRNRSKLHRFRALYAPSNAD